MLIEMFSVSVEWCYTDAHRPVLVLQNVRQLSNFRRLHFCVSVTVPKTPCKGCCPSKGRPAPWPWPPWAPGPTPGSQPAFPPAASFPLRWRALACNLSSCSSFPLVCTVLRWKLSGSPLPPPPRQDLPEAAPHLIPVKLYSEVSSERHFSVTWEVVPLVITASFALKHHVIFGLRERVPFVQG